MKFIKSVSLISLLTLSINVMAEADKSLAECGFPLAGEKFESNLKELLDVTTTPPEIPDYKCEDNFQRYAALCVALEYKNTLPEDDESGLYYHYEKILAGFAKADINKDGDTLFIKKVNKYITTCSKKIICDTVRSEKKKIDLLKVAVATLNWEFLDKAVNVYKFPLKEVGSIDKMTILDFIYEDIQYYTKQDPNGSTIKELKKYYNIFKNSGAIHSKLPITTKVD